MAKAKPKPKTKSGDTEAVSASRAKKNPTVRSHGVTKRVRRASVGSPSSRAAAVSNDTCRPGPSAASVPAVDVRQLLVRSDLEMLVMCWPREVLHGLVPLLSRLNKYGYRGGVIGTDAPPLDYFVTVAEDRLDGGGRFYVVAEFSTPAERQLYINVARSRAVPVRCIAFAKDTFDPGFQTPTTAEGFDEVAFARI